MRSKSSPKVNSALFLNSIIIHNAGTELLNSATATRRSHCTAVGLEGARPPQTSVSGVAEWTVYAIWAI